MNATGIIVEYNPLHNGHLYHIKETRKRSQCDVLIAVMSGDFVQRGEPAILNKHIRARQALKSGVDIVIELPYLYSVQSADFFALGAVSLLDALHVSNLYFGSESGNIDELKTVAHYLDHNEVNTHIKSLIKEGNSYPVATSLALKHYTDFNLINPNDILGVRYIKSIESIGSMIEPCTIKRIQSNYHDESINNDSSIASATSIRKAILGEENSASIKHVVPDYVYSDLKIHKLTSWTDFYPYLKYKIISSGEYLLDIHEMNREIYSRIIKFIHLSKHYETFINSLTTKRLTKARLQRVLCNVLLDVKKNHIQVQKLNQGPKYSRILGISKVGQDYIKETKHKVRLPLITNISKQNFHYVSFDEQITDLYHFIDGQSRCKIPIFD
ncbi:nucleotidyltransferase [Haloplasma contractile]|uniref:tRNA(Met) cytidine acetate ligase n=1 Tax=Haloplasma contractile SSD-17B TaxID=1033810 RepID=U2FLE6_9MOLU|nr:nucleotidyltransferase [Haloplasma contractile]ERJ13565.1 putative nucleotidyltransferase ral function prediction only protein [Haloplasma contractile SSD-17B]